MTGRGVPDGAAAAAASQSEGWAWVLSHTCTLCSA
jgi:hypothetical protein